MPRYEYECPVCKALTELLKTMAERDELPVCPDCIKPMKRVFGMPSIQIGKAGSTMNRDDAFWDKAEKARVKREAKSKEEQKEKLRYNDKETIQAESRKIENWERTGNKESANQVQKKLEDVKK